MHLFAHLIASEDWLHLDDKPHHFTRLHMRLQLAIVSPKMLVIIKRPRLNTLPQSCITATGALTAIGFL